MTKTEPCFIQCPHCSDYSFMRFPTRGYCTECEFSMDYVIRRNADDCYVDPYDEDNTADVLEELQRCA